MKRLLFLMLAVSGLALAPYPLIAQVILKLDTFMYSPALDTVKMVDVILPPGYDQNPNTYYPVVYYLHGWTGDQNSNASIISYMNSYINQARVEPFIMVKPSSYCEPFEGSSYVNSVLWGNYQDYVTTDLVTWIDSTFRTVPQKSHRGLLGQSMGSYGCFYLTRDHPELYRAAAGHAGCGMLESMKDTVRGLVLSESSGPPYTYTYNSITRPWTSATFLFCGVVTPNPNSTQAYLTPSVVDFPYDASGYYIDSTVDALFAAWPIYTVSELDPSDSVSYLYSCGTLDDWEQYYPCLALTDSLTAHGIDVEWLPHPGDHAMPAVFKDRALLWLDSILEDPQVITGIPSPVIQTLSHSLYPNPVTDHLSLEIDLNTETLVRVSVYDMQGRLVRLLLPGTRASGTFTATFDVADISPGTYLLHLQAGRRHVYDKLVKQ